MSRYSSCDTYCVKREEHNPPHECCVWPSGISNVVSPAAERVTNAKGGSQSHVPVRFDLIDSAALFEMAKVLHEGAVKYGEDNWRKIDVPDHLNHLIMHAYAYLSGDRTDEHLSHIMCRATFAQGVALEQGGGR